MLITVQFHIRRAGDVLGEVAPVLDPDPRISALVHHQRGGADNRQHFTHIDGHIHPLQRLVSGGAGTIAEYARERPDLGLISGWEAAAHHLFQATRRHERVKLIVDGLAVFTLGGAELVVRRPQCARQAPVEHQGKYALGIRRGERHAHRHALRGAEYRCAVQPGRVHHRPDVIAALLQRRRPRDPVGQAGTPFVEYQQPRMLGHPPSNAATPGLPGVSASDRGDDPQAFPIALTCGQL